MPWDSICHNIIFHMASDPKRDLFRHTLATLAERARAASLRGPTIIIVGSVVTLREKLNWRG